jgi:hypothetical protein
MVYQLNPRVFALMKPQRYLQKLIYSIRNQQTGIKTTPGGEAGEYKVIISFH